jgi:molybdopterin-binding protein
LRKEGLAIIYSHNRIFALGNTVFILLRGGEKMQLSARNQLKGVVREIKEGPVSTEVVIDINGVSIVSSITTGSVKAMNLKAGDEAYAVIKASSVMVAK